MTQSLLMTCEDLDERASDTSLTCISPGPQGSGSGSHRLTEMERGVRRSRSTAAVAMRFRSWSLQSDSCGRPSNLLISCTHITFWGLSMETQPPSSKEEERLKNEIATLRKRIQILVAEVDRLRRKMESTWGES